MPYVLMGDFGAIVRLGFREIFDGQEVGLVTRQTPTRELVDRLVEEPPDVVMLDLDAEGTDLLAMRIASDYPAVKVIACSSAQPTMRIFPPFHHGESYVTELDAARLVAAVTSRG